MKEVAIFHTANCFLLDIDPKTTRFSVELIGLDSFVKDYPGRTFDMGSKYYSCYRLLDMLEEELRKQFFEKGELDTIVNVNSGHECCDFSFGFEGLFEVSENNYLAKYEFIGTIS